jgi:hypothetical protein
MSRYYGMSVEIKGYAPDKALAIQAAAEQEWSWEWSWDVKDDWSDYVHKDEPNVMTNYGESNLCGGESEEEFAHRLRIAIWRANAMYCEIGVTATYLEDLPTEFHGSSEDEYDKLKAAGLLEPEKEGE